MAGYWNANYWHANYWHGEYWAEPGIDVGAYWNSNYWHANYWHTNYWYESVVEPGDIFQSSTPNLGFNPQVTQSGLFLEVLANTPSLSIAAFDTDANLDIDPPITTPNLPLTPFSASVALEGYQAGDVDLRFVPQSAITVTFGVVGTAPNLPFTPMVHTIEEGGGINVAASLPALGAFVPFQADARLDIAVEPLPPSLPLSAFNVTAGQGIIIGATRPSITFGVGTHTVTALASGPGDIGATSAALALNTFDPVVLAANHVIPHTGAFDARVRAQGDASARVTVRDKLAMVA